MKEILYYVLEKKKKDGGKKRPEEKRKYYKYSVEFASYFKLTLPDLRASIQYDIISAF